jgi:hypothetical protein
MAHRSGQISLSNTKLNNSTPGHRPLGQGLEAGADGISRPSPRIVGCSPIHQGLATEFPLIA